MVIIFEQKGVFSMKDVKRCQGSLLAGAVGDALGYEVEFMRLFQIKQEFGEKGIRDYVLHEGQAIFSDDTQMTLFTAEGCFRATAPENSLQSIRRAYLDWFDTQTRHFPLEDNRGSELLKEPELFARRAPGMTCMSALDGGGNGTLTHQINDSKGCGGVMRVAPIGLYYTPNDMNSIQIDLLGAQAGALTHSHELGWIPCAGLVHMVRLLSQEGATMHEATTSMIAHMAELFAGLEFTDDFTEIMNEALQLADSNETTEDCIKSLGGGWVGEQALAIAVFCALRYEDDFTECICASVNHDGDSDSTGAIAGNLIGAKLGIDAIPQRYLEHLQLRELMMQMGEKLAK